MLPPGHFAAGLLLGTAVTLLFQDQLTPAQIQNLILAGGFFGFAPDLDSFLAFFKSKSWTPHDERIYHRDYITHAPLPWLVISVIMFLFASSIFWKLFAITALIGSWSHFFLDSFKVGIRWLWPFSDKYYALMYAGTKKYHKAHGFLAYWMGFLKIYATDPTFRPTFILEIAVLIIVFTIFVR